jgi:hypothetical protein
VVSQRRQKYLQSRRAYFGVSIPFRAKNESDRTTAAPTLVTIEPRRNRYRTVMALHRQEQLVDRPGFRAFLFRF